MSLRRFYGTVMLVTVVSVGSGGIIANILYGLMHEHNFHALQGCIERGC